MLSCSSVVVVLLLTASQCQAAPVFSSGGNASFSVKRTHLNADICANVNCVSKFICDAVRPDCNFDGCFNGRCVQGRTAEPSTTDSVAIDSWDTGTEYAKILGMAQTTFIIVFVGIFCGPCIIVLLVAVCVGLCAILGLCCFAQGSPGTMGHVISTNNIDHDQRFRRLSGEE